MKHARFSRGVRTWFACAVAAAGALAAQGQARAAMMLHMDLNSVVVSAGDLGFQGIDHTGTLALSADSDAELAGLLIDGEEQGATSPLADLTGEIRLQNGAVVGGEMTVTLEDGSTYTAVIANPEGRVNTQALQGFTIDGLTGAGAFDQLPDGDSFGGVDLRPYFGEQRGGFDGAFFLFAYGPANGASDITADLELYLTVPAPGSVALGGMGLLLAFRRTR